MINPFYCSEVMGQRVTQNLLNFLYITKKWLYYIYKRNYSLDFSSASSFLCNNFLKNIVLQNFRDAACSLHSMTSYSLVSEQKIGDNRRILQLYLGVKIMISKKVNLEKLEESKKHRVGAYSA
jgi:hypothetical protein